MLPAGRGGFLLDRWGKPQCAMAQLVHIMRSKRQAIVDRESWTSAGWVCGLEDSYATKR